MPVGWCMISYRISEVSACMCLAWQVKTTTKCCRIVSTFGKEQLSSHKSIGLYGNLIQSDIIFCYQPSRLTTLSICLFVLIVLPISPFSTCLYLISSSLVRLLGTITKSVPLDGSVWMPLEVQNPNAKTRSHHILRLNVLGIWTGNDRMQMGYLLLLVPCSFFMCKACVTCLRERCWQIDNLLF